jgi:hypothetical protein
MPFQFLSRKRQTLSSEVEFQQPTGQSESAIQHDYTLVSQVGANQMSKAHH